MNLEYNKGRRVVRARAIIDLHANEVHARNVDAAQYQQNALAAVFIQASTSATRTAASVKNSRAAQAEEAAIALAIADTACHTVLSDSRQAVRNFAKGQICRDSERANFKAEKSELSGSRRTWATRRNAMTTTTTRHTQQARALTNRAPATDRPTWFEAKDRMTDCNDITKAYRMARRDFLFPHPRQGRAEAALLRQLQTVSLPSPALMHRMYPETYPTDKCKVCRRETADRTHILWDCIKHPEDARSRTIPSRLEVVEKSYDQEEQLWVVQQVLGPLEKGNDPASRQRRVETRAE
ncbi:hypothetical protein HPB51_023771 [Rhipicephalus microplus]|uniref:Tick transposon n=1 Tax=Rhipicephalus microplus TaxID=6941 RepID=A0A9J6E499_RHIMP|nr:hypothetical protein HPB51_023771 [Rhipicephalus microplus]